MENFYKKHNFDRNIKYNKRQYNIIRYYPKIETYEFLNVGIVVYEDNEVFYRLLSENEISKLHCPILMESKILKNSLLDLDDFFQNKYSQSEIILKINSRYKNVLDTSFQLPYVGNENNVELLDKLFYKYIGYKLEHEKVETISEKFSRKTSTIIDKDFKKHLQVKKSKISGFSLDFYNLKSSKVLHSLIGSINNSQDLFKAFNGVPLNIDQNEKYNFLHAVNNNANIDNIEKLKRNNINFHMYSNDDEVYNYCKNLVN